MVHAAGSPRIRRLAVGLFMAAALTVGLALGPATPASASTVNCSGPRCTVYYNRAETVRLAYQGYVPVETQMGLVNAVLYIASLTQHWFVIQYANQGKCVGFNLSLLPWESQGLFGYRC